MRKSVSRKRKMMPIAMLPSRKSKMPIRSVRALTTVSSRWSLTTLRPNAKKWRDRLKMLARRRRRKTNFSNSRKPKDSD